MWVLKPAYTTAGVGDSNMLFKSTALQLLLLLPAVPCASPCTPFCALATLRSKRRRKNTILGPFRHLVRGFITHKTSMSCDNAATGCSTSGSYVRDVEI